jgi:hypothetical protein
VRETETAKRRVSLQLVCEGGCTTGKCERRKRADHHGVTPYWCSCDDSPGGCIICIEHRPDGSRSFDCFTLGCDPGWECKPQEIKSEKVGGTTVTEYACACVKV